MTFLFVTREEVPRLTVTYIRELLRRQTARQVEPGGMEAMRREGVKFTTKKDFNLMLRGLTRRPRHLHIAWRRLRVAQWTPADVVYLDCWDLV